ncbi:hypothetical protein FA95DRAFT_1557305 [Auriscalpium vulgare]|uniref:Uncharacterized protein n=1 Tax=Auriscalpium vulgare TaxID=40419 RepID=A0ACB8RYR7_9AGAM|nr:hypothetical protein FA95DRAFT_1557305 [Auriscalpium vulgare]
MSSTTPVTTTSPNFTPPSLSSAQPDPTTSAGGGGGGPSSSLYLYTFAATLGVLLATSAFVISRSVARRRRQRAAMLEAIENGTYVPPTLPPQLGQRPRMWEVYVDPDNLKDSAACHSEKGWDRITPVSAVVLDTATIDVSPTYTLPPPIPQAPFFRHLTSIFRHQPASILPTPPAALSPFSSASAHPSASPPAPADGYGVPTVPVHLAVLVSMPHGGDGATRDHLPMLEFGMGVVHARIHDLAGEPS